MMFGRTTPSVLPEIRKQMKRYEKRVSHKQTVKKCYNKKARPMEILYIGRTWVIEHTLSRIKTVQYTVETVYA